MRELKHNGELKAAACHHLNDVGPKGLLGSMSSYGEDFDTRMKIFEERDYTLAESINYVFPDPVEAVLNFAIGEGSPAPDRGSRKNVFNPDFNEIGLCLGAHSTQDYMNVLIFKGKDHSGSGLIPKATATGTYNKDFNKKALLRHNMYRRMHQVPCLVLDETLAIAAQTWAN